jgi:hypothetical protein
MVEQQGNCEKKTSEGATRNIVKRGPALEQQGILLLEDQWQGIIWRESWHLSSRDIVKRELVL